MIQADKEIKEFQTRIPLILDPGEQITKKKSKKIQKIREQLFGIIFSQIGIRQAEKERKKFQTPIPFILTRGRKFRKKIAKKFKKIKKLLSVVILSKKGTRQDEIGRERDKIIFDPNSAHTRPGGENCKKKKAKKFKKLENNYSELFLAKLGLDRPRKRENNFRPQFRSHSTWGRKFRKKIAKKFKKIKKQLSVVIFKKTGRDRMRQAEKEIK